MSPVLMLTVVGLSFHGVGLAAVAWLLRSERKSWSDGFGFFRLPGRSIRLAVLGVLVVAPVLYGVHDVSAKILKKWGVEVATQSSVELLIHSGWGTRSVIAFFALLLAPLVEELLFRGLFFPVLLDLELPGMAWGGTAILFGLIHGNAAAFVPLTLFGAFLAWLYHRTNNLLAPIVAHMMFNLIPFVLVLGGVSMEI